MVPVSPLPVLTKYQDFEELKVESVCATDREEIVS